MKHKNAVRKNLLRTIKGSLGRYLAIVGIIALGAAIFVGLISTRADMVATGRKFMDRQHMFDLRLISSYGWTQEDVDAVARMGGVSMAEGQRSLDVIASLDRSDDHAVYKLHSISASVNCVRLLSGREPQNANECLLDGQIASEEMIGKKLRISDSNETSTLESLRYQEFTVVGLAATPLYMDINRGSTNVGNGTVAGFVYLPMDAFSMDVYTEIAVVLQGDRIPYTPDYDAWIQTMTDRLEPNLQNLADDRFAVLKMDAERAYDDGWREYTDGFREYEAGRQEAMRLLADGWQQLMDAQLALHQNRLTLEDGLRQLQDAQAQLDAQAAELDHGRLELENSKQEAYSAFAAAYEELLTNFRTVQDAQEQVRQGLSQLNEGLAQMEAGITQLSEGLAQIEEGLQQLQLGIALQQTIVDGLSVVLDAAQSAEYVDEALIARLEQELAAAQNKLNEYLLQQEQAEQMQSQYSAQLAQLQQQYAVLQMQKQELLQTQAELNAAMTAIEDGLLELELTRQQTEAQFAIAQAQLDEGALQLQQGQAQLDVKWAEARAGMEQLEAGQAQLDEAFAEYAAERESALAELEEAKRKLSQAEEALSEARQAIDSMAEAEIFLMDRNTNAGFLAVDNNSQIVAGVSRVFPAFFLLVAALVCITTMTRMVEEERTQIGTLKALGYGSGAIARKYLLYAGSAAIVGCGLGTVVGSMIFPVILWDAYQIIMFIPENMVLLINWPLCLAVVAAYTAVVLLVTWYCCYRSLRLVPAELIRPKAPTSGKKILLEYLPLWRRFSFLNKVMLRNVFRYRQRMLMMLLGIGGCTALLLTGFGLRDSIVNMATDQFSNVLTYDMQIYFSEGQSEAEQEAFLEQLHEAGIQGHFLYQTGMDLEFGGVSKDITVMVTDEGIEPYMTFRMDGNDLEFPGVNEAILSEGMANILGISEGDIIYVRNEKMQSMQLVVDAIFHNNLSNYLIISSETLELQWGEVPRSQMLLAVVPEDADVYQCAAEVGGMTNVINVAVSDQLAGQMNGMLEALDTIVLVIVICAGILAMIVLYNLTNINITERIREIATIKVLGFRSGESAAYVFKENLLLTAMGTLAGLPMGYLLLKFVITQVRIDLIWISSDVTWGSCTLCVVITMVFGVLVDCLLYRKLENINMAEALKSVE